MRRGVWLLVLGLLAAALGATSAYAAGSETSTTTTSTTTTSTTTTSTTTTSTTPTTGTTTTAPSPPTYSRLAPSYLPAGCVGAGSAAIAVPGRQVLALGTPATSSGPSAYPTAAPIVRFLSSAATGSGCTTAHVALGSVALFGGVITATSIEATHGKGTVSGLAIYGSPVALSAGRAERIGGWGEVTLQKTVGRLAAPLVVQLVAAHRGLPAGTTIAVAFGASPQVVHKSKAEHNSAGGQNHGSPKSKAMRKNKPPPDFPAAPDPFVSPGVLAPAARHNPIVSTALQYLGIRYQWGGASPETGFDCSGLVKYVFAQFGVALVHYAAAQWHTPDGVWVAPNQLRPGDLVFFVGSDGTRKAPGHVGIYVDDGYFIDAPHTGSFVRIDSLTEPKFANQYVGARRIDTQLLVARHLVSAKPETAWPFPHPLGFGFEAVGAGPVLSAALPPASARITASQSDVPLLVGGPLGGALALSVVAAGAFTFRRRRRPAAAGEPDLPESPLH